MIRHCSFLLLMIALGAMAGCASSVNMDCGRVGNVAAATQESTTAVPDDYADYQELLQATVRRVARNAAALDQLQSKLDAQRGQTERADDAMARMPGRTAILKLYVDAMSCEMELHKETMKAKGELTRDRMTDRVTPSHAEK